MAVRARVFRIPMADPADMSGLAALFDSGELSPEHVVAILGKTEGNGCVNDFTRGYATPHSSSSLPSGSTPRRPRWAGG